MEDKSDTTQVSASMEGHVQENIQDSEKMIKKLVKINKSSNMDSLLEKSDCYVRGKDYTSPRSLFEHLRCHPERDYRGIKLPKSRPNEPGDISYLPRWSVKAKRGCRSLFTSATSSSLMLEEDIEAVHDLVRLSQCESFDSVITIEKKSEYTNSDASKVEAEVIFKEPVFKLQKGNFLVYESKRKKLKINETMQFEAEEKGMALFGSTRNYISSKEDESWGKNSDSGISNDELLIRKMGVKEITEKRSKFWDSKTVEKKDKKDDIPVEERPSLKYICSTCNKCFASHQALGGHRSSHNRSNITNVATIDTELVLSRNFALNPHISRTNNTIELNTHNNPVCSSPKHQCKICDRIFPTGQALGGHQRCHWAGPAEGQLSSHAISLLSEESIQKKSRQVMLEFDLNEPASMEDDDGGVESQHATAGEFGYSSFSHITQ